MIIAEKEVKSALSESKIFPYTLNPYTGCQHACSYCYARFMLRYSHHSEAWGQFVDVKTNMPELLAREVRRKPPGRVWISGVCDPYQPVEARYRITRQCLQILFSAAWPVTIQTRSPLILQDLDILAGAQGLEAGLSITTADDSIRRLFEPQAPPIKERLDALEKMHRSGIRTYAMIAPVLPGSEDLGEALSGRVDYVLFDKMNYHYADRIYQHNGLTDKMRPQYYSQTIALISKSLRAAGVECRN